MPVRRAEVRIDTEHQDREVVLFLAPETSPEDLFEQDAAFFPAEHEGHILLFARSAVVSIVVDDNKEESLSLLGIPCEKRPVAVHLRNGKVISGTVEAIGRTRTLDLLNQPARSFAVRSDGKIHLVAKAHVEHIVEIR